MRWRLEEIARREEKKGNKMRLKYGRIRINGQRLKWDEEKKVLEDGRGIKKRDAEEKRGEGRKRREVKENGERKEKNNKRNGCEWKVDFWNVAGSKIENFGRAKVGGT